MSSKISWKGENELAEALRDLSQIHPPPTSKVKNVVSVAFKYSSEFKMVAYDIEKWMKKSGIDDKIAGLFVIDSICRGCRAQQAHNKEKDFYSNRFAMRIPDIFLLLNGLSDANYNSVSRVVEEWIKGDIFPKDKLQASLKGLRRYESVEINTNVLTPASTTTSKPVSLLDPRIKNKVVANDSLISSLSIPKPHDPKPHEPKPHEPKSQEDIHHIAKVDNEKLKMKVRHLIDKQRNGGGIPKFCSFREGSCPYGERCRFQHGDGKVYFQSLVASKKRLNISSASNIHVKPKSIVESLFMLNKDLEKCITIGEQENKLEPNLKRLKFEISGKIPRVEIPIEQIFVQSGVEAISMASMKLTVTTEEIYLKLLL